MTAGGGGNCIPIRLTNADGYNNQGTLYISDPQLIEGYISEDNDSMSEIKQTANEIVARVNNTGIDIITGEVTVFGGKFTMKKDRNSSASFELDSNGNLKSNGDAQFEGKIKATSGEFTGKITASDGSIGGFNITGNEIKSTNANISVPVINTNSAKIHIDNVSDDLNTLLNMFHNAGINVRVTSGYRENAKTKQGNKSHHSTGMAIDIVPEDGDFNALATAIKSNP